MPLAATQIYSSDFDAAFLKLPVQLQTRLQEKIDELGRRLETYPHSRMTGIEAFRLRVGDYRIIYRFDLKSNEIYLAAVGHRSRIYR
jgi:mRNA interferase RelE/StbE